VTKPRPDATCLWCRRPIVPTDGPGRPRRFCRQSCRQRDYEARRRATELGLNESDLIVARSELNALTDQLYVLEAAVEDVMGDLARSAELEDYKAALAWVLDAARPLIQLRIVERVGDTPAS
jgi:hypothetical protein